MRKVTTINLNGRAYQLEEQAYEKLQAYLRRAEANLADDPDKAEVMSDIEQAIADKCDRSLTAGKDVVSEKQVAVILEQMGEVESEEEKGAKPTAAEPAGKRLYVIREGAMLMGVCTGVGAYLGIDANLVRVAFILLTLATGGFWVLVYLLLGLLLPAAKTEADLAEAYGKPLTAQAIVEHAKERAPDAASMRRLSEVLVKILRIISRIVSLLAILVFAVLTAGWLWAVGQLVFQRLRFYGQLQVMNGWREWLVITALYLLAALPALLIARLFARLASSRPQTRVSNVSEGLLAVLWGLAVVALISFGTTYAGNFRGYANGHGGKIDIGRSHICVDRSKCGDWSRPDKRVPYPPVPVYYVPPIPQ